MASNQFVVDLGNLSLSSAQRKSLNAAIQGAVTNELARFKLTKRIVLIPVDKWPKGPILDGIIARPFDKNLNKNIQEFL
ncbi:MAG TPA: hypothetical protein VF487_08205 [Chitinophagaceae bacterium]